MLFARDTDTSLEAALRLANNPPRDAAALAAFRAEFEYTAPLGRSDLADLQALGPRLRELLLADRDTAALLSNAILAEAKAVPQLVRHPGWDWHLHAVADDAPFATWVAVETAMAMVDLIRLDAHERLAVCSAPDCENIYLDQSKNRSKRYCSMTCGNRVAASNYRARNTQAAATAPD